MNARKLPVVIHGVSTVGEVPGIETVISDISLRCAPNLTALRDALPGASVLLGWKFDATELHEAWDCADQLRWIQWPGAGVDAVLCPFLVESDIVLTNMHGVFDRAIAEYILGLILAFAKDLPETCHCSEGAALGVSIDRAHRGLPSPGRRGWWNRTGHRSNARSCRLSCARRRSLGTRRATVISLPSTPAEILDQALTNADYVVVAAPLTDKTRGLFGAKQFTAMKQSARFIKRWPRCAG